MMYVFKIVVTVIIVLMMLTFVAIGATTKEKSYNWVWCLIETVYAASLIAIWG